MLAFLFEANLNRFCIVLQSGAGIGLSGNVGSAETLSLLLTFCSCVTEVVLMLNVTRLSLPCWTQ